MKRLPFLLKFKIVLIIILTLTFSMCGKKGVCQRSINSTKKVITSSANDMSIPLRDIIPVKNKNKKKESDIVPNFIEPLTIGKKQSGIFDESSEEDLTIQDYFNSYRSLNIKQNFEGLSNPDNLTPPDPNGNIGLDHYFHMVNSSFSIYNKKGDLLYGPAGILTLFDGFSGINPGEMAMDPIVLYDQIANRWFVSSMCFLDDDFSLIMAVSETNDPLGSWYRYKFEYNYMPDYPKYGVWHDGYYFTAVTAVRSPVGWEWDGAIISCIEKHRLLKGEPNIRIVTFNLGGYNVYTDPSYVLPSDNDGIIPPTTTPNYFAYIHENEYSSVAFDQINILEFHTDWVNIENCNISEVQTIEVSSYNTGGYPMTTDYVTQPNTDDKLNTLDNILMANLQYRHFEEYDVLMATHTVYFPEFEYAGVRWYELHKYEDDWEIHQQSTFSPDTTNRWQPSIAMNGIGDIGLGYSLSGKTVFPSMAITGRASGDPIGVMTAGESLIASGSNYQSYRRWGDYSMMSVDPSDNLTFWYTNEYIDDSHNWKTKITAFKVSEPENAYFNMIDYQFNDTTLGNGNGEIENGETIKSSIQIKNIGLSDSDETKVLLYSYNPHINILDSIEVIGTVSSADSIFLQDCFTFSVSENIQDKHNIVLLVKIISGNIIVNQLMYNTTAFGHEVIPSNYTFDDSQGNNNLTLDQGEEASISIPILNIGSRMAKDVVVKLSCMSDTIDITGTNTYYLGDIHQGDTVTKTFTIHANNNYNGGYLTQLQLEIVINGAESNFSFDIMIGKKPLLVIDLDPRHISIEVLSPLLDSLQVNYDVTNRFPDKIQWYKSFFIILGGYGFNKYHRLSESELSVLTSHLQNNGNLYIEGSDRWFEDDPGNEFWELFGMKSASYQWYSADTLIGTEGSGTQNMTFPYLNEFNFLSYEIDVGDQGIKLITSKDSLNCIVAYSKSVNNKTIGSEILFGKIEDGGNLSTKENLLKCYLDLLDIGIYSYIPTELISDFNFRIFPNPVTSNALIKINTSNHVNHLTLEIFDIHGKLVSTTHKHMLMRGEHTFSINDKNDKWIHFAGMYICKLTLDGKTKTDKIVVIK